MVFKWYYYLGFVFLIISCSTSPTPTSPWQKYAQSPRQLKCMAETIHGEARGEPREGQVFVGQVVLTRIQQGYGKDVCSVVYAKRQFAPKKNPKKPSYVAAQRALELGPNGVTHFHSYKKRQDNKAIFSVSKKCEYQYKIGQHWGFVCHRRRPSSQ